MDRATREAAREAGENLFWTLVLVGVLLEAVTLALWPLHRLQLAFSLAKGLALFLLLVAAASFALGKAHDALRVNLYDRPDAFLLSNLAVSALLVVAWAAFAALAARSAAAGAPVWAAAVVYAAGLVGTHLGYTLVSAFWTGTFYRYRNLPVAAAAYLLFCLLPAAARFLVGWFPGLW